MELVEETITTLRLNKEEINWLRYVMKNPFISYSPDDETKKEQSYNKEMRLTFYNDLL